jgi:cell division protein FtsB
MPPMMEKIKDFFRFLGAAWTGGFHGKIGVLCAIFAAFMFFRIFFGEVTVQRFVINIWRLNAEQQHLAQETAKLESLQKHIQLLQGYSPDYVEELGLKYLNIGDPRTKILKI